MYFLLKNKDSIFYKKISIYKKISYKTYIKTMKYFIFFLLLLSFNTLFAQTESSKSITKPPHKYRFEILPSLAYQPETGFRYGANVLIYHKFSSFKDTLTRYSKLTLQGFNTTKKQFLVNTNWQIYTKNNKYALSGYFQTGYWVDRYYKIGNTPNAVIEEYNTEKIASQLNYANYEYNFINFYMANTKQIYPNLYAGFTYEYDKTYNNKFVADTIVAPKSIDLKKNTATRSGLGLNLTYDTRDNTENPLHGTLVTFNNAYYNTALGGSSNYRIFILDAVKYINTFKDQTFALRIVVENRAAPKGQTIPLRGMAFNGGISALRGYFTGTFRGNNLLAFESEYRLPLFIDADAPPWKIWKRTGLVAFASVVKVDRRFQNLWTNPPSFHAACGVGLRYMIDTKNRVNLSIDYAVGLDKMAGLNGQRQKGFYFYLIEAF